MLIVAAEHNLIGMIMQQRNQRFEILGGTAFADQDLHASVEFVLGLLIRKAFVIGAHTGLDILLGLLAA